MSETEKEQKSCTFFRKPRKGGRGMRKRKGSSGEEEDEDESAVVKVQRKKIRNPMVQTSGNSFNWFIFIIRNLLLSTTTLN